jgi:predicted CXXCH cytochrome family protein
MKKLLLLLPLAVVAGGGAKDSCIECHANLDGNLRRRPRNSPSDIHAQAGLGCADCHGGDHTTDDYEASMSRAKGSWANRAHPSPRPARAAANDANLMHKYKPQQRVDQMTQYQTSVHGKRLAAGDDAVATCIDCHSVHDIRAVKDALSPVHPLRLPGTCAHCHADRAHMAKYKIETNQFSEYRTSVHWEAVSKRGDLSAPTCASCHGNHGATPPQVSSIANVCGTCHVLFEELYNKSPHQPVFSGMGAGGCVVCHNNHAIKMPSVAMLAGSQAVCAQCHDASSQGGVAPRHRQLLGGSGCCRSQRRANPQISAAGWDGARRSVRRGAVAASSARFGAGHAGIAIAAETHRAAKLKERVRAAWDWRSPSSPSRDAAGTLAGHPRLERMGKS